ncbi:antibiotic biosynthesis monooxygenase [Acetobacter sp. TBRC 12305]|uniref:Antibiotic biosynthesis monooxygenase n=1 Tax=Acetobacter garciniae TaxID=2817435 RepID=A0A939HLX8_9PROT|nr:putative quinol monooxygenase [Acetobacter garciniae]MBO1325215.1 antibiotic biosynthesis monooxygenase [Acetobacter garciniae]MBX0344814.1 antibiotic biosynthesis monooxygenase [Acetobacter garciniae]
MSDEISVVAILKAKPGCEAAVAAAMVAGIAPSRAEAGNRSYVPTRDQDDPHTLMFVERWASRQAFAEHLETPHFKLLAATLESLLSEPPKIHMLEALPT